MLSIYMMFDKDFSNVVTVRVTDAKGLEIGRCCDTIAAKNGDVGYYDFRFDRRTNIDSDSKIIVE